jgi:hypothetical protein
MLLENVFHDFPKMIRKPSDEEARKTVCLNGVRQQKYGNEDHHGAYQLRGAHLHPPNQ